jgi:hypothetical protein
MALCHDRVRELAIRPLMPERSSRSAVLPVDHIRRVLRERPYIRKRGQGWSARNPVLSSAAPTHERPDDPRTVHDCEGRLRESAVASNVSDVPGCDVVNRKGPAIGGVGGRLDCSRRSGFYD